MDVLFVVSEEGFWAEECMIPLEKIEEDHRVTVATPTGGKPVPDKKSMTEEYREILKQNDSLNNPVSMVEAHGLLPEFDAVVFPGGHGTMWDINQDRHAQDILVEMVENGKALVICHAVGLLAFARDKEGYVVEGRNVTGFPNEWEEGQLDENQLRDGRKLPYWVETEVERSGADWDSELDQDISVTVDGNLITARGPDSSLEAAETLLGELE